MWSVFGGERLEIPMGIYTDSMIITTNNTTMYEHNLVFAADKIRDKNHEKRKFIGFTEGNQCES